MDVKYRYLLVISIISFSFASKGQQKIDSLKILQKQFSQSLNDSSKYDISSKISSFIDKKDTNLIMAWIDSSLKYVPKFSNDYMVNKLELKKAKIFYDYNEYDSVFYILNKLDSQLVDSQLRHTLYYYKALTYNAVNVLDSALSCLDMAQQICFKLNDTANYNKCIKKLAFINWRQGLFKTADSLYLKSYFLSILLKDSDYIGATLNSLGAIAWGQGRYVKALNYYKKAMDVSLSMGNKKRCSIVINNIGLIYKETKDYNKALANYKEGLKIAKQINYEIAITYSYNNIAQVYLILKQYKKALLYCDSTLFFYKKNKDKTGLSMLYREKAEAYTGLLNYKYSIHYLLLAIERGKKMKVNYHLSLAYQDIAEVYYKINKLKLANQYVEKSLVFSKNNDYLNVQRNNYTLMADIDSKLGDFKHAYEHIKKANIIKDSIRNKEKLKQIAKLQVNYELVKIEREKQILEKEKLLHERILKANKLVIYRQKLVIGIIIFSLLVSLLFIIVIRKQKQQLSNYSSLLSRNKIKLERSLGKLEEAQIFKNKIFSIIGHDLRGPIGSFNAMLDIIGDESHSQDKRKYFMDLLKGIAVQSFNLLENLLQWAKNENQEIKYSPKNIKVNKIVKETLLLVNERAETKNINIICKISDNIEIFADYNTFLTIVRNILTNAMKFTPANGQINIIAYDKTDEIEICIKDNGLGISQKNLQKILNPQIHFTTTGTEKEKGSGLGMKLIIEFIKGNGGTYSIKSREGKGTSFCFCLPKAKNTEKKVS